MGSARLRRAVFGVPPNTLEGDLGFTERWTEKARSQGRRRNGSEGTRDACAPVSSAWIRLNPTPTPNPSSAFTCKRRVRLREGLRLRAEHSCRRATSCPRRFHGLFSNRKGGMSQCADGSVTGQKASSGRFLPNMANDVRRNPQRSVEPCGHEPDLRKRLAINLTILGFMDRRSHRCGTKNPPSHVVCLNPADPRRSFPQGVALEKSSFTQRPIRVNPIESKSSLTGYPLKGPQPPCKSLVRTMVFVTHWFILFRRLDCSLAL